MTNPLIQALPPAGRTVRLLPCEITDTSPLEITLNGTAGIPGVPISGLSYSTGFALALLVDSAAPVVIPIG